MYKRQGIDYQGGAPAAADWVRTVGPLVAAAGYGLVVEPGLSLIHISEPTRPY